MVPCLTVDDSQINNLSQVNISVIQYFEFQGKLLGPLQQPRSEVKVTGYQLLMNIQVYFIYFVLETTVDWEIFAGTNFRRLNFRVVLFSSTRPLDEKWYKSKFYILY